MVIWGKPMTLTWHSKNDYDCDKKTSDKNYEPTWTEGATTVWTPIWGNTAANNQGQGRQGDTGELNDKWKEGAKRKHLQSRAKNTLKNTQVEE